MARPRKTGIDYFPFDVDFLSDIKIRKILRGCGEGAIGILISVLSNIYRDEGYFILVDDDFYFFIADELGITEEQVAKVISKGVEVELFNKRMFDTYKILTSSGIQKRYMKATEKRKNVELEKTYCIVGDKNISSHVNLVNDVVKVEETELSEEETPVNDNGSTQSIVQDSKGQESKVTTTGGSEDSPSQKFTALRDFETLWLFPNQFQKEDLYDLIDKHGEVLVSASIRLAGSKDVPKNNAINFLKAVLKEWAENNVTNLEQVDAYQLKRDQQNKSQYSKPTGRTETMPAWAEEENKGEEIDKEKQKEFAERLERIRNRGKSKQEG